MVYYIRLNIKCFMIEYYYICVINWYEYYLKYKMCENWIVYLLVKWYWILYYSVIVIVLYNIEYILFNVKHYAIMYIIGDDDMLSMSI